MKKMILGGKFGVIGICLLLASCAPSLHKQQSAPDMIDAQLIRGVADKMMRSLLDSDIMQSQTTPPKIALLRFRNKSRFPMDASIFVSKLRADLNSKAPGRVTFLARENLVAIKNERKGKREGMFSFRNGNLKKAISGADYFLTGELRSLTGSINGHRSEYMHLTFYIVNAENSDILWEDQFDLEFKGTANVIYR